MGMHALVILAQAIAAQPAGEAASPTADVRLLEASPGGRYLAVADAARVYVLDATTLERRTTIEASCSAAAFDAEDRILTLVDGAAAVRLEAGTWRELSRAPLPGADFLKEPPGRRILVHGRGGIDEAKSAPDWDGMRPQPAVTAGGDVLYRSRAGDGPATVSRATWENGRLKHENLGGHLGYFLQGIDGVLGAAGSVPVVGVDGGTGIILREKAFALAAGDRPLASGVFGERLALSTRKGDLVYDLGTFRCRTLLSADVRSAAFGPARGWAFRATEEGVHAWRPDVPGRTVLLVRGSFDRIAVDGSVDTLFAAASDGRLRRWTLAR